MHIVNNVATSNNQSLYELPNQEVSTSFYSEIDNYVANKISLAIDNFCYSKSEFKFINSKIVSVVPNKRLSLELKNLIEQAVYYEIEDYCVGSIFSRP